MQKPTKTLLVLTLFLFLGGEAYCQLIPFCQKTKWGFASTEGKLVIPCTYDQADFYSGDNLAKVKKAGKFGYINKQGAIVIALEYDDCHRIYEVFHGEHSVGIETNPSINLNRDYDWSDINNNRYVVSKNKKYGILSLVAGKPKVILPCSYSKIMFDPSRKVFHCTNGTSTVFVNKEGQLLTKEQVDAIALEEWSSAFEGDGPPPIIVSSNGKYGVVREKYSYGKPKYDTLIPVIYDNVIMDKKVMGYGFIEDFFAVKKGDKWGCSDNKHHLILPIEYDSIHYDLSKHYKHWLEHTRTFYVKQNGKWGVLGKKDTSDTLTQLLPFEYDAFSPIYYSYTAITKSGSTEIYDNNQHKIITKRGYTAIRKYEHESVGDFEIFEVTNKAGQTVYVGENGVEFFTD